MSTTTPPKDRAPRVSIPAPKKPIGQLKLGQLKVLVCQQGSHLVAQCLQYDFAVQGHTIPDLKKRMAHTIATQVILDSSRNRRPLSKVPKAPKALWDAFKAGSPLSKTPMLRESKTPSGKIVEQAINHANFALV